MCSDRSSTTITKEYVPTWEVGVREDPQSAYGEIKAVLKISLWSVLTSQPLSSEKSSSSLGTTSKALGKVTLHISFNF